MLCSVVPINYSFAFMNLRKCFDVLVEASFLDVLCMRGSTEETTLDDLLDLVIPSGKT